MDQSAIVTCSLHQILYERTYTSNVASVTGAGVILPLLLEGIVALVALLMAKGPFDRCVRYLRCTEHLVEAM